MADAVASETKPKGSRTGVRKTFLVFTWVIIAGIATQVTLIGLGLFYRGTFAEAHIHLGFILGHLGPLLLILGFFGRMGRKLNILNAVIFVLFAALPFLAASRGSNAVVAGLHPLVAFAVFGLTLYLSLQVLELVRKTATPTQGSSVASKPTLGSPPTQPVVQGRLLGKANR